MSEAGGSSGGRSARALDALVAVAVRLAAAEHLGRTDAEPALRAVADAGAAALRVTAASIALHDPVDNRLVFRAAAGPQGGGVVGLSVAPNEGIAGYAFATGQPLAIADVATDPRFERETAERTGYVPRSLLAVPLVDEEGIVGVMEWLDRLDGAPFDLNDLEVATRVAAAATATARATGLDRAAGRLLRRALEAALADATANDADAIDADAIDALVAEVSTELAGDDPLWRLADRIGQLRAADPDDVDLAVDWLDALLARTRRRSRPGRRSRG
ncbi:MAG TPA: GAF domain-containing protein [Solirubrobacteraceae bacterium]|nr:GAF domain-containing protein [Solirubrobacteraceae bacterium]